MKHIFAVIIFFCHSTYLLAQSDKTLLVGRVLDSVGKIPLDLASITIYKLGDSVAEKKTLTNKNGVFEINNLSTYQKFKLIISHTGYDDCHQEFSFDGKRFMDLGDIRMKFHSVELDTVFVQTQLPSIIIKKDTVEYNASSFKTRPNAVIEELLRKLPGLEIDVFGNIKFHGRTVSKILIDGREFFGNDFLMATRNLPADMVNKIQVTDTRTMEQVFSNRPVNGMDKTINIKLKKTKNDLFGYIHGGIGTDQRYEFSGMINYFDGNKKLTVVGSDNNINNVGFSSGADLVIVNPGNGVTKAGFMGINYTDEWSRRLKVGGSYSYQNTNTTNESLIDRKEIIVPDSTFFTNTKTTQQTGSNGHRAQFTIQYEPDSSDIINITPEIGFGSSQGNISNKVATTTTDGSKINESQGNNFANGTSNNYSVRLFWGKKLNDKGQSFTVNAGVIQNQQKNTSLNASKNIFYKNNFIDSASSINQKITNNTSGGVYEVGFSFNEPISNSVRLILQENLNVTGSTTDKITYSLDSSGNVAGVDSVYSGKFNSVTTINTSNFLIEYNKKKWEVSAGVTGIYNQLRNNIGVDKSLVRQHELNFSPSANIIFHFNKEQNVRFNYSAGSQQPIQEQLQPVPDNSNPLYVKLGNPYLRPSFFQNYGLSYSMSAVTKSVDLAFQYSPITNKIVNEIFYDDYGRQASRFINVNGSFGLGGNINFTKYKKTENINFHISTGITLNYNRDISMSNNQQIVSNITNGVVQIGGGFNYKELVSVDCNYNFSYNDVKYNNSYAQTTNYTIQSLNGSFSVNWNSLRFINNLNYLYNSNISHGFSPSSLLWNVGISKSFFKKQNVQGKLIIYDLLKQNTNLRRTITSNYIEDSQSNILQRYALLSMTYYFKNSSKLGK
ncbi:MAG: outer membrane beta-barrel protein [Bacteroidetes bacterium]|nr:outer membrane beta-barrel protein [Bacteroidota bacterium]